MIKSISFWRRGAVCLAAILTTATAWSADKPRLPAEKPAPPAEKPTPPKTPDAGAPAPVAGSSATLAGGLVTYTVPDETWIYGKADKTATRDTYIAKTRDAAMMIEVLPAGTDAGPDLAAEMVKKFKQRNKAAGRKQLEDPQIIKDERFLIKIRERYEVKDKVADQLHLYRQVGKRIVLVTINSLAGKVEETAKAHHKAGEDVSLSAEAKK